MINADVYWSLEERELAVAVLGKIAHCQDQNVRFPVDVFEALCRAKKNVSTELVLFNEEREVYLIRRSILDENPDEPYPGQFHSPGVTHNKSEGTPETLDHLRREEGIDLRDLQFVCDVEMMDPPRAMYLARVHVAQIKGQPVNPQGRFFAPDDIPWDKVIRCHREVLLPLAIAFQRTQ